jgi:hypothetical protein
MKKEEILERLKIKNMELEHHKNCDVWGNGFILQCQITMKLQGMLKDLEPEFSKTVDENFWDLI